MIATIYWAHIGRVIYAASNEQLAQLTGPGNKENFTMRWHTRDILLDQQQTAKYISLKLYKFLVNEQPDTAKVEWLADRFYKNEYDIARLLASFRRLSSKR